jgi:DNA-binding beta-propeller fold protein YncE
MLSSRSIAPCWTVLLAVCFLVPGRSTAEPIIETVAGTGQPEVNGDRGPALTINIGDPFGVEIGPDGALYVTEVRNHRVMRVDLNNGHLSTVAGNGTKGYSGDGGPATAAQLNEPYEVRFDSDGNMFFVEMQNHLIRRVEARTGTISTIAGTGQAGYGGDGGPAVRAQFRQPHSIVLDGRGGLYVADIGNHRIRRIDLETGRIESVAGTGDKQLPVDGQIAKDRPMLGPRALFIDGDRMWIALREGHSIWRMSLSDGRLKHIAGTGVRGYTGDGGPALQATFDGPKGIAVGPTGDVFVVDTENQAIRKIDMQRNTVTTIAGSGRRGGAGDGGIATQAELGRPHGICVDRDGRVYIGDTLNHRVRRVR